MNFRDRRNLILAGGVVIMVLLVLKTLSGNPGDYLIHEILMIPGIVIGLSFHEYAHALAAYRLGDPTPKFQGRLTVNPMAHVDPFGFIALLLIGFGWGRPVEINPYNFKKPRRDELIVSLAGVTMNLVIAAVFSVIYRILSTSAGISILAPGIGGYIGYMIFYIIYINIVLMIFNLLPVPPLDGFGIVTEIFDLKRKPWYYTVYSNGFFILMILIIFNVTDIVLHPLINVFMGLMGNIMY